MLRREGIHWANLEREAAVDGMEGSLYEEQRKMVAQLAGDIKAEDDLFMSRVLAAYISEEELNKADDEIKIFSEYSF